ncbi:hypothetical protein BH20ACT24_BH20ACT24_20930 [soil metagenome]
MHAREEIQAVTLRVPKEVHEALRTLSFATGTSINDLALRALGDFLAEKGHREAVKSFLGKAQEQYRVALDKLRDL